jgi:hypothetical protein
MAEPKSTERREHPRIGRLRWILENRVGPQGKRFSKRSLSIAALGESNHSHCAQLFTYPGKAGKPPGINPAKVELDTWRGYARAANVRTAWLMDGIGAREPFEGDDAPSALVTTEVGDEQLAREAERYPTKAIVYRVASTMGYPEAALVRLLYAQAKGKDGQDPGEDYWWVVLDESLERVTQQAERLSAAKAILGQKPA